MDDRFTPSSTADAKNLGVIEPLLRFVPKVRRAYLFGLAGFFWTLAGGILCLRGSIWLLDVPLPGSMLLAAGSLVLAWGGYAFGFSKIVRRNLERITSMPERASIIAFTPMRGYLMIGLMMSIGITLRNSALPKYFLIVPYFTMGFVLLAGSTMFYRSFLIAMRARTSPEELHH